MHQSHSLQNIGGICADSYESAICGFWNGGIVLNLVVISGFSFRDILCGRKILLKIACLDTFEIWKNRVRNRYP